jgi:hypothetical protein
MAKSPGHGFDSRPNRALVLARGGEGMAIDTRACRRPAGPRLETLA